ncbi:signal peptidase complex catalytic subunit SEC11 [Penicillium canescens]|nr:signal peptidase complex catalytic subunit SEC11 [Penicillium canescens]KAJ6166394.1 signal peptidase complex catalytic subunit SEC11 [Penicillium canescens]
MRIHCLFGNALTFFLFLSVPLMIWKALCLTTASPYPIVVVISESMAPAFHRGDILFLSNRQYEVSVGDIPVVWFPGNPLPMVHRAIQVLVNSDSAIQHANVRRQYILTKGDNNPTHDMSLYPLGQAYVAREEIVGLVRGYLPCVGWATIALSEYPWLKGVGIGVFGAMGMLT